MPAEEAPPPEPPKPRRRWKRWGFAFLLVLTAFLIWANGPGIRWGVKTVILQQLEAQKLTGTFQLEGTALTGLAIHNLSLTGESRIQSVESNFINIDWSLSSLRKKELKAISINKLHIVIAPSAPNLPDSPEKDLNNEEPTSLAETLDLVRGFIQPARISLSDLKVEVLGTATVSLGYVTHSAGDTEYAFDELGTRDHTGPKIKKADITMSWSEEGIALGGLQLTSDLEILGVIFEPAKSARGAILINGSRLTFTSDLAKAHRLTLDSPTLKITTIAELIKPGLKAGGTIIALEIDTAKGLVNIQGRDLQWEEQKLASLSIEARAKDIISPYDNPIEIKVALADQLDLTGTLTPAKDLLDAQAELAFTLRDPRIPTITGELVYDSREARVLASALGGLSVNARYFVDSSTYEAEAISALKDASQLHKKLTGPLDFTLTAKGTVKEKTHSGKLKLTRLQLNQSGLPDASTSGIVTYDWPRNVSVQNLTMTSPEGQIKANLAWQDDLLTISQLDLIESGTKLLTATAKLPAPLDTKSLDDLLNSTAPISLVIKSQALTFKKLSSFAPIPPELSGIVQADFTLSGSLAKPALNGFATLDDFRTSAQPDLPPVDLNLNFKTKDDKLLLTAKATEPGGPLLNLDGSLPFLPRAWINRKTNPNDSPVNLRAYSPDLDLRRVQPFVPIIQKITGSLKLDVLMSGTISDPKYSGSAKARIPKMRLAKSPISDFRDLNFNATFLGKTVTIQPSTISASGGTAKLSGTIDLAGKEPLLDVKLSGRHILLYRTPDYTFRGHPDLNLRGPFSKAKTSGSLQITESLFYKDLEILPFGVPRTTDIPRPNLPSFSAKPTSASSAKPTTGVMAWGLNLNVTTADPILIRGNLARGEITGNVKVTGTIGNPKTSGTLTSKDLEADLPFSHLKVQTGVVTLRPDSLTNPIVNLRGSSTVGQYTVQVYLTGPVQNPTLILTSNPPLPEPEIMLLLATGSASAELEDRQVASQKALQYLLEGLRRRNRSKDKSVFQRLLKNSDQIELSLGDTNQFSGRKYSSATLEIDDQWDFTTQINDQGQTRALVVFSVRLK
jgi:autotransporter translocation and assembly factor TamB